MQPLVRTRAWPRLEERRFYAAISADATKVVFSRIQRRLAGRKRRKTAWSGISPRAGKRAG